MVSVGAWCLFRGESLFQDNPHTHLCNKGGGYESRVNMNLHSSIIINKRGRGGGEGGGGGGGSDSIPARRKSPHRYGCLMKFSVECGRTALSQAGANFFLAGLEVFGKPNSLAQSRPFDLLVFPCWSIFSKGPNRLTFYFQVFWASEQKLETIKSWKPQLFSGTNYFPPFFGAH